MTEKKPKPKKAVAPQKTNPILRAEEEFKNDISEYLNRQANLPITKESIESIKVGATEYKVNYLPDPHDADGSYFGICKYPSSVIEVQSTLSNQLTAEVLLHESIHAILFAGGVKEQSEQEITILSNGIMNLLRENPLLKRFIAEAKDEMACRYGCFGLDNTQIWAIDYLCL